MTADELKHCVKRSGMTRSDLSRLSGRSPRQATSWLTGVAPVPRSVAIIVRAINEKRVPLAWLMEVIHEETMLDGATEPPEPVWPRKG